MLAPHPGGGALFDHGFPTAGCAHDGHVGIFVFALVEEVQNHRGIVMLVGAHQDAGFITNLKGRKHIGAGGGIGKHIPFSQLVQLGIQLCQRQGRQESPLLHIGAVFEGDLFGGHHLNNLADPVFQILFGKCLDGDKDIEIVKLLPIVEPRWR